MIPDPSTAETPNRRDGAGGPARDGSCRSSRAGTCWLCGQPVEDPPEIIGQWRAHQARIAHRRCLQILGALDLNLPFPGREPDAEL